MSTDSPAALLFQALGDLLEQTAERAAARALLGAASEAEKTLHYVSASQGAERIDVSPATFRAIMRELGVAGIKLGNVIRYPWADVERAIAAQPRVGMPSPETNERRVVPLTSPPAPRGVIVISPRGRSARGKQKVQRAR